MLIHYVFFFIIIHDFTRWKDYDDRHQHRYEEPVFHMLLCFDGANVQTIIHLPKMYEDKTENRALTTLKARL
jgi:hypothetical protein